MSFTSLTYHIVYSTKERIAWLEPDIMQRLVQYTGGILRRAGGVLLAAGGTENHLHVLADGPSTKTVAALTGAMKSNSSRWLHDEFPQCKGFAWQDEYAAFTVSRSGQARVEEYIAGQAKHHAKMDFVTELKALLDRHGIEYDPKYLQ